MSAKIAPSLLLAAAILAAPAADARMLAVPPGAGGTVAAETATVKGNGLINQIVAGKNILTINGMDFTFIAGRARISGADAGGLKAGQQVEYTAAPEGKMQRITEIRVLPVVAPSKPQ